MPVATWNFHARSLVIVFLRFFIDRSNVAVIILLQRSSELCAGSLYTWDIHAEIIFKSIHTIFTTKRPMLNEAHKKDFTVINESHEHYLKNELYEQLRADPAVFDFLLQASMDGLWYRDLENPEHEWMSDNFWTLLGYAPQDKQHRAEEWQQLIHPDDFKTLSWNFQAHVKNHNHPFDQIVRFQHKDGSIIWVRCRGMAIRDDHGKPIRMLAAHHDITQLKKSEEIFLQQLQDQQRSQAEARFRLAVDAAPNAMAMVDENGLIVMFNHQAERMFQYTSDEIIGQPVERLVPIRHRAKHPGLRKMFSTHPATRPMGGKAAELHAQRRDGTEIPVEIGLNPVTHEDGDFVLISIVDISERRRMESMQQQLNEELAASNEALRQSNQKLQQFASMASHDLQAPLRHIGGLVQLLLVNYTDELDEKANDLINRTVQSVYNMQSLIDGLLTFSRLESRSIHLEPVAMHKAYGEAVEMLSAAIHESNAQIKCDYLPAVQADRTLVVHLLQNLIMNGIKYCGTDSPRIHISAQERDHDWVISVSDNGIGIDGEFHDRIFEPFQRLHSDQSRKGNGLGLAICRNIVQRHGGDIWLDSQTGQGSTFYFNLPKEAGDLTHADET